MRTYMMSIRCPPLYDNIKIPNDVAAALLIRMRVLATVSRSKRTNMVRATTALPPWRSALRRRLARYVNYKLQAQKSPHYSSAGLVTAME